MQKTGIIRKVDDLGRIVIPKEIRKTIKIHEGDEMEIVVEDGAKIVLKKYSPLDDVYETCSNYIKSLSDVMEITCMMIDLEKVLFVSGTLSKKIENLLINEEFVKKLIKREVTPKDNKIYKIFDESITGNKILEEKVAPLIIDGSVIGAIVLINNNVQKRFGIMEEKILEQAISFFKLQMEI
ncbi:stage V sporulation protein T [Clostridium sp. CAG:1219]|nr:stage V sporulation protein T [Clostridium sp. CAG:1219]